MLTELVSLNIFVLGNCSFQIMRTVYVCVISTCNRAGRCVLLILELIDSSCYSVPSQTQAWDAVACGRFCLPKFSSKRTPLFVHFTKHIPQDPEAVSCLRGSFWEWISRPLGLHVTVASQVNRTPKKRKYVTTCSFFRSKVKACATRSFTPTYLLVSAKNGRNLDGKFDLCSDSFNLAGMASFFEGKTVSLISFCERDERDTCVNLTTRTETPKRPQFDNFTFLS